MPILLFQFVKNEISFFFYKIGLTIVSITIFEFYISLFLSILLHDIDQTPKNIRAETKKTQNPDEKKGAGSNS